MMKSRRFCPPISPMSSSWWRRPVVISLAVAGLALAGAPSARAQVSADDRVAAESLFADARRLMHAGEYERACEKLEASRALEPALGATLNLADCYEKIGRTASAWAEFKVAAGEAQRVGDATRKATALERASALEPRLSRLWLQAADPSITVLRNGELVKAGILGNAIPVDPGTHRLEAKAPGKAAWTTSVDVAGEGATVEIRIPPLADLAPAAPIDAPMDAPVASESGGARSALTWVSAGIGLAGIATGVTFGLLASSSWSKVESRCRDGFDDCPEGVGHAEDAGTRADVATVAFIVGGVGLGASLILLLTDSDDAASAELALEPTRMSLRGRF
jgi:hypothetical protein